jgi:hypothetical protein
VAVGLVVFAFMAVSLAVTATGTARFAAAMGYSPSVGYVVGAIFDIAKDVLLVAVLALWTRRALVISAILCLGWIGLVTYSALATHATITTAISAIERTGAWTMEVRGNVQAELNSLEQQIAALSHPVPPRPVKSVRAAVAATRVQPAIWKDSRDCAAIQESAYFAKACAQVVQLRAELTAAEEYERLSARANELRKSLAESPIIVTSDPLPAAFAATLGRLLPVGGTEGVALLLTMVVEILSCFGLAALRALYNSDDQTTAAGRRSKCSLAVVRDVPAETSGRHLPAHKHLLPEQTETVLPGSSPKPAAADDSKPRSRTREERAGSSSNVVQMRPAPSSPHRSNAAPQGVAAAAGPPNRAREEPAGSSSVEGESAGSPCTEGSHVPVPEDSSGTDLPALNNLLPEQSGLILPGSSPKPPAAGHSKHTREEQAGSSSNVVPIKPTPSSPQQSDADPQQVEGGSAGSPCTVGSHVPAFARDRLRITPGPSVGATDIRDAYLAWCTKHGYTPLSWQKLAPELALMGFTKWKSCGRMRYRDLQLVA